MRTQSQTGYRNSKYQASPAGARPSQFLKEARQAGYAIPLNPNGKVNKTLRRYGLTRYPSPIPDADVYLASRIKGSNEECPKSAVFKFSNYGTFALTSQGEIVFAKLRCGPRSFGKMVVNGKFAFAQSGGLEREVQVMQALKAIGYQVPAVYGYYPTTPEGKALEPDKAKTLEMLLMESVPPEVGSVLPLNQWTPEIARLAARKIKTFNQPTFQVPIFQTETVKHPLAVLVWRSRLAEMDEYKTALIKTLTMYEYINKPIVVHGDAWPNNVIVKHQPEDVIFIDWEMAGAGYLGQDAGRMLWGLTLGADWELAEVSEAAVAFINEWCKSEDDKAILRFGVLYESLRWIAEDRQDKLADQKLTKTERLEIIKKIAEVKAHTLKILSHIPG